MALEAKKPDDVRSTETLPAWEGPAWRWKPEAAGYTTSLDAAGEFTHEDYLRRAGHVKDTQLAVPVEEADALAERFVRAEVLAKVNP